MNAKLSITYDFDFELIGIVSTAPAHKLAWLLNNLLQVHFVRGEPATIAFVNGHEQQIAIFDYKTEHDAYQLLRNRALSTNVPSKPFLLPELKDFDYFLRIDNATGGIDVEGALNGIVALSQVQYCAMIEVKALKDRENLLF